MMRCFIPLVLLLGVVSVHSLPKPGLLSSLTSALSGKKTIGLSDKGVTLKNTKTKSNSDVQEKRDSSTNYAAQEGHGYYKESGSQTDIYSKDEESYNEETNEELNLLGGGDLLSFSEETKKTKKESSIDAENKHSYTGEAYNERDTSAAAYSESERSKYEATEDTYTEETKKSYGLGLGGLTAKESKDLTHESSSVKKEAGSDYAETEYNQNGKDGSTSEYTQSASDFANEENNNSVIKESTSETKTYDAEDGLSFLTGGGL